LPAFFNSSDCELSIIFQQIDREKRMKYLFNLVLRFFATVAMKYYFRQWEITGTENIPAKGPVIFAANHQNAFLDAILITCSISRKPWFLARASVFKSHWAAKALHFIRMMPIYRIRDGISGVKRNDEVFEACMSLLAKNNCMIMFPEGNHAEEWNLRSLQRGLPRIALGAENNNHWQTGLKIIPVGLHYEKPKEFRSRVLIKFDKPFDVADYKENYLKDPRKTLDLIKDDLYGKMKKLVFYIPPQNYESLKQEWLSIRPYRKSIADQLAVDQDIIDSLAAGEKPSQHTSDAKPRHFIHHYLSAWLIYPFNILPYKIINWVNNKFVTDHVFTGSIKYAGGLVLVPLFYLTLSSLVYLFTQNLILFLAFIPALLILNFLGLDALKNVVKKSKP